MYEIWYCSHYPLADINLSKRVDRTGREVVRAALAEDIREHGLVNPIVVLNHRPKKYQGHYCQQGLNRLNALGLLGWSTVPVIFTGPCEYEAKVPVEWDRVQEYFFDGVIRKPVNPLDGLKLEKVITPDTYKYPSSKCQSTVRDGPYLHEDYKHISV